MANSTYKRHITTTVSMCVCRCAICGLSGMSGFYTRTYNEIIRIVAVWHTSTETLAFTRTLFEAKRKE